MKSTTGIFVGLCWLGLAIPVSAIAGASGVGEGCGVWGPVTYVATQPADSGNTASMLAIINNYVCFTTASIQDTDAAAAVLTDAMISGKLAAENPTASGLQVAIGVGQTAGAKG